MGGAGFNNFISFLGLGVRGDVTGEEREAGT